MLVVVGSPCRRRISTVPSTRCRPEQPGDQTGLRPADNLAEWAAERGGASSRIVPPAANERKSRRFGVSYTLSSFPMPSNIFKDAIILTRYPMLYHRIIWRQGNWGIRRDFDRRGDMVHCALW